MRRSLARSATLGLALALAAGAAMAQQVQSAPMAPGADAAGAPPPAAATGQASAGPAAGAEEGVLGSQMTIGPAAGGPAAVGPRWASPAQRMWLEPWRPAPPPEPALDPVLPPAIAELSLAGLFAALSPVLWATAPTEERCGRLAGCVTGLPSTSAEQQDAAVALGGASIGLAAVAAPTLLNVLAHPLPAGKRRRGAAYAVVGHVLLATSASLMGSGVALLTREPTPYTNPQTVGIILVTGGALGGAAAVPPLVAGAPAEDATQVRARELRGAGPSLQLGAGSITATWEL